MKQFGLVLILVLLAACGGAVPPQLESGAPDAQPETPSTLILLARKAFSEGAATVSLFSRDDEVRAEVSFYLPEEMRLLSHSPYQYDYDSTFELSSPEGKRFATVGSTVGEQVPYEVTVEALAARADWYCYRLEMPYEDEAGLDVLKMEGCTQ